MTLEHFDQLETRVEERTHELASVNADISEWKPARELYQRAMEVSERGHKLEPERALFVARKVQAMAGLAYCEAEIGDEKQVTRIYEEAHALLDGWHGEVTPELRLARAEVGSKWGTWTWGIEPERGRKLFIEAAEAVIPLLSSDVARYRQTPRCCRLDDDF